MRSLFAVLVLAGVSSALHISAPLTKEQIVEKFGSVNWNPNTKTKYCDQCVEIEISSVGGALEHQPNRLGRFTVAGALWENMVPIFKADNGQYMTPDPNSNPIIYYLKWVVSETVGGFNAGIQNSKYTDGITCPWDAHDSWEYEYGRQWFIDPTLKVKCVRFRDQE
eukprot:TRINITY_DN907_c0_g1_i2.p1 TRINITY_DN907_c0_g1~~TRINITY_DN907_c0_g1_i2.p1  ORF type:complete len:166 (+),score=31.65 TRINITY_DN907_c0_g1_i2:47-544(+)